MPAYQACRILRLVQLRSRGKPPPPGALGLQGRGIEDLEASVHYSTPRRRTSVWGTWVPGPALTSPVALKRTTTRARPHVALRDILEEDVCIGLGTTTGNVDVLDVRLHSNWKGLADFQPLRCPGTAVPVRGTGCRRIQLLDEGRFPKLRQDDVQTVSRKLCWLTLDILRLLCVRKQSMPDFYCEVGAPVSCLSHANDAKV